VRGREKYSHHSGGEEKIPTVMPAKKLLEVAAKEGKQEKVGIRQKGKRKGPQRKKGGLSSPAMMSRLKREELATPREGGIDLCGT